MLAARAPGLQESLERALAEEVPYRILDGKVVDTDRCRKNTLSREGKTIDLWYAGKTHDFGGNIQALFCPSGIPLWVSDVLPGNVHDLAAARQNVLGVLRPFLEAREINVSETSLGNWVRDYRKKHAEDEPPLELSERARLRELEREVRELRMKADFLSKAVAVCHKRRGKAEASGHPRSRFLDAVLRGRRRFVALRSRPAGGGFKPPHAALAEDRRGER